MHNHPSKKRLILVVEAQEAFYELIQSFSSDTCTLIFAADPMEADRRLRESLPDLIVLEAPSIRREIPPYLSRARARGVAVLALTVGNAAATIDEDEIPLALFDRVASLVDRPALVNAARVLLRERRLSPRINTTLSVVVDERYPGELLDLSPKSLRIRTDAPLAPDQRVGFSFEWGHQTIAAAATVHTVSVTDAPEVVLRIAEDDEVVEVLDRMVRKVLEVDHYRSTEAVGADTSVGQGPVAWQLARRAERALRQTGSFHRVSARERKDVTPATGLAARYEMGLRLGRWGIGEVFEAQEHLSGRAVVLKILHKDLRNNGPARARLEMEARAGSELSGVDGVVTVLDFGGDGEGGLYYALEPLEGEPLATLLAAGHHFTERDAARMGVRLAETLSGARDLGHGHHDLCPENIFMERGPGGTWLPRLLSFAGELPPAGAREIHARGAAYWPPEATECPADEPGDAYALCGLLRDVWGDDNARSGTTHSADTARHKLHRLLWFGTADHPGDRYQRLDSLAESLKSCSEALDKTILGPPASIPTPAPPAPRQAVGSRTTNQAIPAVASTEEVLDTPTSTPSTPEARRRLDTLQPAEILARRRITPRRSRWRFASGAGMTAAAGIAAIVFLAEPKAWPWPWSPPRTGSSTLLSAAPTAPDPSPVPRPRPVPVSRPVPVPVSRPVPVPVPRPVPVPASGSVPASPAGAPQTHAQDLSRSQIRRYYRRRAKWYIDRGKMDAAQRNLTRALRHGDSHRLRKLLARAAQESGHPRQAIRHLQRAARLAPYSWRYRLQLGRLLIEIGRTPEACRAFRAAIINNPKHSAIRSHHRRFCEKNRRSKP